MIKQGFVVAIRVYFALAAAIIAILQIRPDFSSAIHLWPFIEWIVVLGAVLAAVASATQATPGRHIVTGLSDVFPTSLDGRPKVIAAIRHSRSSIRVVDSYWGDIDSFRDAITDALVKSGSCRVQILLAKKGGHLAKIRDAANPRLISVDENIDGTITRVNGLRQHVDSRHPGLADHIDCRFYDAVVPGPFILVDDKRLFAGTFLQSAGSPSTLAVHAHRGMFKASKQIVDSYVDTFERLWESSVA